MAQVDEETYESVLKEMKEQCAAEHDQVVAKGGLHIIGTERHEARRIDNQLRGRSGRQGDRDRRAFICPWKMICCVYLAGKHLRGDGAAGFGRRSAY